MYSTKKMKFRAFNFLFFSLVNLSFAQSNPSHFKSEIDFGSGTVFSTFLDVSLSDAQFSITSPKDADVRIFGSKAKLGRAMGKSPKKGIIIAINGRREKDSLFGETNVPMVGKLTFEGLLKNGDLSGVLLNKDLTNIGDVQGKASDEHKIDYNYLYPMFLQTVRDNIYSESALQNKEWKKFENDLRKLCSNAHDDIELYLGFNILSQKLPFTHLSLAFSEEPKESSDEITDDKKELSSVFKSVIFEEKNKTTAYLQIKNFSTSKEELAAALPKIVENENYKNLIIDLRDNGGGGISAAFELAKYIVSEDLEIGYFPTNKLRYNGYQPELFATLPELQPKNTHDFGQELKTTPGVKLIFKKPSNPIFKGTIYVLTNSRTGSTCEPIVYALKKSKRAVIIGENTYGGMLAASPFTVFGKYMLMLPVADFYTYDGIRLDKVGVAPDIFVKSEDAERRALEIIAKM